MKSFIIAGLIPELKKHLNGSYASNAAWVVTLIAGGCEKDVDELIKEAIHKDLINLLSHEDVEVKK